MKPYLLMMAAIVAVFCLASTGRDELAECQKVASIDTCYYSMVR
jgi:hypothetical protein